MRESSAQNSQRMFGRTDVLKSLSATDAAALNSVTTLDLSKRGIKSIDFDFGELPALRVLNLSGNELTALPKSIGKLTKLTFLNVASNKLRALPDISALVELRSILANDNELTEVAPLSSLLELCTLVLSHNALTACPNFAACKELNKLSLSHNQIRTLPASISQNHMLKAIRVNNNQISALPDDLQLPRLKLVDLGNNLLNNVSALLPLQTALSLDNLNLKGNLMCNHASYKKEVMSLFPKLELLDYTKVGRSESGSSSQPNRTLPNNHMFSKAESSSRPAIKGKRVSASAAEEEHNIDYFSNWPTGTQQSSKSTNQQTSKPQVNRMSTKPVATSSSSASLQKSKINVVPSKTTHQPESKVVNATEKQFAVEQFDDDDADEPVEISSSALTVQPAAAVPTKALKKQQLERMEKLKEAAPATKIRFDDSDDDQPAVTEPAEKKRKVEDRPQEAQNPDAKRTKVEAQPRQTQKSPKPQPKPAPKSQPKPTEVKSQAPAKPALQNKPTEVPKAKPASEIAKIDTATGIAVTKKAEPKESIVEKIVASVGPTFDAFGAGSGWD